MPGWCPFAVRRTTNNYGYPAGTIGQNKPVMFVDHTMGGFKRTLDDPAWREPNGVGVHFGIGLDGSISQYTNIFDASWGNGVSGSIALYDRANPRLAALEKLGTWASVTYAGTKAFALVSNGVNVPNSHSISTEHEDAGKPDPVWPQAMLDADLRVKQWCLDELAAHGTPMGIDPSMLVGHNQIDGVNRAHCPGTNYPRTAIYAGLQPEDDVKSFLAWDLGRQRVYFCGPDGPKWIVNAAIVAELEKTFGKMSVALSTAALQAMGAT